MRAVIQDFKTGRLSVENLPTPSPPEGFILVKNKISLLSAGTERAIVETARESLLKKAAAKPELISQLSQSVRKEGIANTHLRPPAGPETGNHKETGKKLDAQA